MAIDNGISLPYKETLQLCFIFVAQWICCSWNQHFLLRYPSEREGRREWELVTPPLCQPITFTQTWLPGLPLFLRRPKQTSFVKQNNLSNQSGMVHLNQSLLWQNVEREVKCIPTENTFTEFPSESDWKNGQNSWQCRV